MKEERKMQDYEKTVFLSREDAEKVAKKMLEYRVKYGKVTLYDYHDMCGHIAPMDYTRYGWVNLKKIDVRFSIQDGGFILDLPEPICLDTAEVDDKPGVEQYCPYLPYTDSGNYISKPGSYTITKFPLCIGDACMAYEDGRCKR